MPLEFERLTEAQIKEIADLIQQMWAIQGMLENIARKRGEAEGIWSNRETTLSSKLTVIRAKLAELRQPTETE